MPRPDAHVTIGDVGVVVSEHEQVLPALALRDHVAGYSGYRQVGVPPLVHHGLPSPYLTFIITLDEPLVIAQHPDPRDAPGAFDTLLGGLHTTPAIIVHEGRQSGIQVNLHPRGARALFGLPAGELASLDVEATAVGPTLVRELQDRVRTAADWPSRFRAVDRVLTAALQPAPVAPELVRAWRLLSVEHRRVDAVAAEIEWSTRRLSSRFTAEYGVSPQQAARIGRFDRARRLLGAVDARGRLAEFAVECGYFDQAHLARDFRDLAGTSVTAWLAENRRFVQAGAHDTSAG